ncbi:mucin-2-like [Palaemon carinicauda]|uniref:mucin-2-like n=1 Tax=Palaemon carinicauda TaxID=392227 RepID=UPI0035B60020
MLPPAVRWLCMLLLAFEGAIGQLSIGESNSFLLEDLEPAEVTTLSSDIVVGEEPQLATESPPADTEDAINPEAVSDLEDGAVVLEASVSGFGREIESDAVTETPLLSSAPELTKRILVSGTPPATPVPDSTTTAFSRHSSLVRFLSDPNTGWLPNWPAHLLPSSDDSPNPTIIFPSEDGNAPNPTIIFPSEADEVPAATPVPLIEPSLTVSKVPITQYYFDITSVGPARPAGPLYDPEELDLLGSLDPGNVHDTDVPAEELASSIPELQSSAVIHSAEPVSVTPTLPDPEVLPVTESPDEIFEILSNKTRVPGAPTEILPSLETEIVGNDLTSESYNSVTALASDIPNDLNPTGGLQPSQSLPDLQGKEETETTTPFLTDPSSTLTSTDPIAVLTEDPSGISAALPDSSATSTSHLLSGSELVSSPSTNSIGSIKPTSARPLQTANISRTPLWMLLSQSVPTQSLTTRALHTTLTSPVVSVPVTDTPTTTVPALVSSDEFSDAAGEVSVDTDLVSSLLIDSKFTSPFIESPATTIDILDSRTLLEDSVSSIVPSLSLFSPEISAHTITDTPVSIVPTEIITESYSPAYTLTSSLVYDSSLDESPSVAEPVKPSDIDIPTTPATDEISESNIFIPTVTPPLEETEISNISLTTDSEQANVTEENSTTPITVPIDSSETPPQETNIDNPLNSTLEYHEGPGEPLIVPKEDSWPLNSSSDAEEGVPIATKIDNDDWTPVVELTEKSVNNTTVDPTSTLNYDDAVSSSVSLTPPELIGGFIPIISETNNPDSELSSELMPENTNILSTSAVTALTTSTFAPAKSHSTMLKSPSFTDSLNVHVSSVFDDPILSVEHHDTDEQLVSSVVSIDGLISSNLLMSTTHSPELDSETTSVPLTPSFDVSVTASDLPVSINILQSETMTTNLDPSVIVVELPSSSSTPVFDTEIMPSPTPTVSEPSVSMTEGANMTSVPSFASVDPSLTETSLSPFDPSPSGGEDPLPSPIPSLPTTPDLSSLIIPTATEEKVEVSTIFPNPEITLEEEEAGPEEGTPKEEPPLKEPTEGYEEEGEVVFPEEPPYTTEKEITTKTPEFSTTPLPPVTTTPSTLSVTILYPDSRPTLTTSEQFPNGTVYERPLPYVKALVAYSQSDFCQHKNNFRSMFAEWISQHLQEDWPVSPSEIEFFNMPDCGMKTPSEDEHINLVHEGVPDPEMDLGEKMNSSLDELDEVTSVYFYVTKSGKINPNLTEMFPLFPMDLEISENLTYLKGKVSQLELVRPGESSDDELLPDEEASIGTSTIVSIAIATVVMLSIITAIIFFMIVKKRGNTNNYYGRRCTPVSMDAYSMDSVSVYHSFRRKSKRRASGRSVKSYLNQAFDDPNGPSRPLNFAKLTHFISDIDGVHEEFSTIPVNMPKYDELPAGVEDKNRYANVIPVPETRVLLKCIRDSPNSEYINANYVRGPRNESKYYIATQAPLDDTVADFWRMIWEQETRVVVMLTDFVEKGIDKCADYLPPSETLDCHRLYGDFQVTLKSRDMREKYVVSNVQLKNLENNLVREIAHMWFTGWPASGVPNEESAFISYILDIRRTRKKLRAKGPILVHCSPGTGRSGTFLACDLVMRQFEDQRNVDIPRTVYSIRRDRAGAVQTKEQYAFIYRVINLYASKLTTGNLDSL